MAREEAVDVEQASQLALRLGLLIEDWFAQVCDGFGLTPTQAAALRCLDENGACPQGELARYLNCDASYVTAVADRLEQRGAVARRISPVDRRVKLLELTPAGARLLRDVWKQARATSPMAALTPQDRAVLAGLAAKVLDAAGTDATITKRYT